LPRIHVYAFSTSDDPILDVANRVCGILQCDLLQLGYQPDRVDNKIDIEIDNKIDNKRGTKLNSKKGSKADKKIESKISSVDRSLCWGHIVRDVAPKKVMICLTFQLPYQVAEREPTVFSSIISEDSETKRKQVIDDNDSDNKKKMKPDDNN